MEHTNTLCTQNAEYLILKEVVHTVYLPLHFTMLVRQFCYILTNHCLLFLCLHSANDSSHFLIDIHLKCKVIIRRRVLGIVDKQKGIVVGVVTGVRGGHCSCCMHCPIVVLFSWGTQRFQVLAKHIDCYQSNLLRKTLELHFRATAPTLMIPTYNPLHAIVKGHQTVLFRGPHNQQSMCVFAFHITCTALKTAQNKIFYFKATWPQCETDEALPC